MFIGLTSYENILTQKVYTIVLVCVIIIAYSAFARQAHMLEQVWSQEERKERVTEVFFSKGTAVLKATVYINKCGRQ